MPLAFERNATEAARRLRWLRDVAGRGRLRVFHVLRNPFDMLATQIYRDLADVSPQFNHSAPAVPWTDAVAREFDKKFRRFTTLHTLINEFETLLAPGEILYVHDCDFLAQPIDEVRRWCDYLDLRCSPLFLERVTSILKPQVYKSRFKLQVLSVLLRHWSGAFAHSAMASGAPRQENKWPTLSKARVRAALVP